MRTRTSRCSHHGHVALALGMAGVLAWAAPGLGVLVPGGGIPNPKKSDCYVEMEVEGVATQRGGKVECTDGDPACDDDGACNGSCEFHARLCPNQTNITQCRNTAALSELAVTRNDPGFDIPGLDSSSCAGAFTDVEVPTRRRGNRELKGKLKIKVRAKKSSGRPKTDADTFTFTCKPRTGECPGPLGFCTPSQQQCNCGTPAPAQIAFVSSAGQGNCGTAKDGAGNTLIDLACGGLYFGGGVHDTPLPAQLVDLARVVTSVTACTGQCLTLANTTQTDTGSQRTCTSAGCLFGAPLPIVNTAVEVISTCLINVVAQDATGEANCQTGEMKLSLPLNSNLYLSGDLLPARDGTCSRACTGNLCQDGTTACNDFTDCPVGLCQDGTTACMDFTECPQVNDFPGTQPCPICVGTPGAETCKGGANDGDSCTPETSNLGAAFPTSQDCAPSSMLNIGALSVPFALTTGTDTKTAAASGTQQRTFCGFCRDKDDGTDAFAGTPTRTPVPCTSNSDCANVPAEGGITFESCEQKDQGCFKDTNCNEISEQGVPAGSLVDRAPHAGLLGGVFCIPPAYNGVVDPAASLPGPGAASLPGTIQLLP